MMATLALTPLIIQQCPSPLLPRSNVTTISSRNPSSSSSSRTPLTLPHINPNGDDVVSWTSSIARHARSGRLCDAFSTFSLMLSSSDTPPNHITLLTLLSACADFSSAAVLPLGLSLHAHILKRFPLSLSDDHAVLLLTTALLDFYSKCGRTDLARHLFARMPNRNSFSFNAMIAGHMKSGEIEDAISVFRLMPPHQRDKVSWTALIDGFVKNGFSEEALQHFREMQQQQLTNRIEPDYVMIIAIVAACTDLGALGQGTWVHRYATTRCGGDVFSNVRLANSLIDMYSRCGRVDLARQVFDSVEKRRRTRVTWNSMIVGFAVNGCCREALAHFDMMLEMGIKPDGVSFTGALTACTHAGLVDEGMKYYYKLMKQGRSETIPMRIEHYGCVVDLLGRAGHLEEAMRLVERMVPVLGPNEVVLGSLLAACRVHGNIGLAERLMRYLVELEPDTDSNFVLLSNIYASVGRWDGAGEVRNMMKSLEIRKSPGFSAIEVDGASHEFVSGDKGHARSDNIYDMLQLLTCQMKLPQDNAYDSQVKTLVSGSNC